MNALLEVIIAMQRPRARTMMDHSCVSVVLDTPATESTALVCYDVYPHAPTILPHHLPPPPTPTWKNFRWKYGVLWMAYLLNPCFGYCEAWTFSQYPRNPYRFARSYFFLPIEKPDCFQAAWNVDTSDPFFAPCNVCNFHAVTSFAEKRSSQ